MSEEGVEIIFKRALRLKSAQYIVDIQEKYDVESVTLVIGDLKLKCPKVILAAESAYFKAMFNSNMKESYQDEVSLKEIDINAVAAIMEYFCTDEIKLSESNIFDVIEGVEFLQIASLRPFCDQFLSNIIASSNCIAVYSVALQYNYIDVSRKAFYYVLENFSKIYKGDNFLEAPFDFVFMVFNSRVLEIESEAELCYSMRYWINYDIKSRHKYLPDLLKLVEINKIVNWVPLDVDKYLIDYGIIDRDLSEWLSLKRKENTEKISRMKSPVEVCFAIGGYTYDSRHDCNTLSSIEVLHEREKWQFNRPECLLRMGYTFFQCNKDIIVPSMSHRRSYPAVAYSDGSVYVMGGNNGSYPINHAECYDAINNKWRTLPALPFSLEGAAATCVNGRVYLTGGYNQNIGINNKVWFYDEGCTSWRDSVPMLYKRSHHCVVAVHGVIFAIGGSGEDGLALSSVECFYVGLDSWIEVQPLSTPRSHLACVVYDDQIYAICGNNTISLDTIERYDVSVNQWQLFNKFIGGRHGHGASVFQNRLLIFGGRHGCIKACDYVHKLNLKASSSIWHESNKLILSRVGLATVTLKLY